MEEAYLESSRALRARNLSGVDRENAETLALVDYRVFDMSVSLWNLREDDGTWKLMGDIKLNTRHSGTAMWGGLCFGFPD